MGWKNMARSVSGTFLPLAASPHAPFLELGEGLGEPSASPSPPGRLCGVNGEPGFWFLRFSRDFCCVPMAPAAGTAGGAAGSALSPCATHLPEQKLRAKGAGSVGAAPKNHFLSVPRFAPHGGNLGAGQDDALLASPARIWAQHPPRRGAAGASGAARPAPGGLWGWRHVCLWRAESKRCHFALPSERCRFALRPRSPALGRWQPQPGPGLAATRAPAARPSTAPAKPSSPGLAGEVLAQPPSRPLSSPLFALRRGSAGLSAGFGIERGLLSR